MEQQKKIIADAVNEIMRQTRADRDEIERLRKDKTELLKALTDLHESCRWEKVCPTIDAAKDAIAKATRGK